MVYLNNDLKFISQTTYISDNAICILIVKMKEEKLFNGISL